MVFFCHTVVTFIVYPLVSHFPVLSSSLVLVVYVKLNVLCNIAMTNNRPFPTDLVINILFQWIILHFQLCCPNKSVSSIKSSIDFVPSFLLVFKVNSLSFLLQIFLLSYSLFSFWCSNYMCVILLNTVSQFLEILLIFFSFVFWFKKFLLTCLQAH